MADVGGSEFQPKVVSRSSLVGTVIVLYGPKAVGKTQIAMLLERALGIHHLDCDVLITGWLAAGIQPHPTEGWLDQVEGTVLAALAEWELLSVEATGAWPCDWQLADDVEHAGHGVHRIWVHAPWQTTLERLRRRESSDRVPASEDEARVIYEAATEQASIHDFDLAIPTAEPLDQQNVVGTVGGLLRPK